MMGSQKNLRRRGLSTSCCPISNVDKGKPMVPLDTAESIRLTWLLCGLLRLRRRF